MWMILYSRRREGGGCGLTLTLASKTSKSIMSMIWVFFLFVTLVFNSVTKGGQIFSDSHGGMISSSGYMQSSHHHEQQQQQHQHMEDPLDDGPSDPETAAARERCSFPAKWFGNWFQSGVHQTITISRHAINVKGRCLEADQEKFIVYNEQQQCFRCVVFHEKHQNVLQYKETFCVPERRSLRSICSTITGDANLFSMFRLDAQSIDCPFRGPFTFTYNRGHGDCRYPLSTIDSCLHSSRLLLNYQACPDVPGTESTVEELECLGSWKEGSSRYLLGLIQYRHPSSYEDRFRCFVYEKVKKNFMGGPGVGTLSHNMNNNNNNNSDILYRVSMSGDATCNGLTSMEGSRILTLRRAAVPKTCQFPSWLQLKPRGSWNSLDGRSSFAFESSELRVSNSSNDGISSNILTMTAVCSQIQENPTLDKVILVLHTTSDCRSGYICMAIYRREGHIIELQIGNLARRLDDACHISYFDQHHTPFITLISSTPETRQCPNVGQFEVTGIVHNGLQGNNKPKSSSRLDSKCPQQTFNSLSVGCNSLDTLQFRSDCSSADVITEYSCHGFWEERGISFLIASPLAPRGALISAGRYCFVFRENPQLSKANGRNGNRNGHSEKYRQSTSTHIFDDVTFNSESPEDFGRILQFSSMADSCHRHYKLGIEGEIAFNVTSQGRCNGVNEATRCKSLEQIVILTIFLIVYLWNPTFH